MLIRVGYEIVFDVPAPAPMLLMLDLDPPARRRRCGGPGGTRIEPFVPVDAFHDRFGNRCMPGGRPGGPVPDLGRPGRRGQRLARRRSRPGRRQHPVEELPDRRPGLPARQPLLRGRPAHRHRLGPVRQDAGGWARVQAVCDWVHNNVQFGYQFARPTKTAYDVLHGAGRGLPRLHPPGPDVLPLPEHPGAVRDRLSRRHRRADPPSPMDFSGWFEVYLDDQWYTFDARHNMPRIGRVVMARGRDAVDVALTTSFGKTNLSKFTVWTDEVPDQVLSQPPDQPRPPLLPSAAPAVFQQAV